MHTPSLCGSFLVDRRSLVAFTWTITTVLTLVAFIMAVVMMVHVHTHYKRMEHYYEEQYEYTMAQYEYNNQDGGEDQHQESADRSELDFVEQLSSMSSKSMTFVAIYTVGMAISLNLYGTTAIVGFTSLQGVYIAPCFSSSTNPRVRLGIFGGAIIFFANLLLLCAVIFGEVRVEDWSENNNNNNGDGDGQQEQREPYEIERISAIMAITCMFLSAMYTVFAILLFLYAGSNEEPLDEEAVTEHHRKPSLPGFVPPERTDPRRESFIVGRA